MRPLICPQCGGQIDQYAAGASFTVCEYCGTRFLVEENKAPRSVSAPVDVDIPPSDATPTFIKVLTGVMVGVIIVIFIAVLSVKKSSPRASGYTPPSLSRGTPTPIVVPTA